VKQAKALGLPARLCGADGWDNDSLINGSGDNVEGCFLVGAFSHEDPRPAVQSFIKMYEQRAQTRPGTFEALGYDTASLLIEALKSGLTPEAVKNGLRAIGKFEAVTGTITIDAQGDAIKSAVILKIVRSGDKFATKYVTTVDPR
jgi:branched-chain amino acid transport system substrate-binding protein